MNEKHTVIALLLISFSVVQCAQESNSLMRSFLPKEIISETISYTDLATVGRFGQTSQENNTWYRDFVLCKNQSDMLRMQNLCLILQDRFDDCTRTLVFYAKECTNNPENKHVGDMFQHLWKYHENKREIGVRAVLRLSRPLFIESLEVGDILDVYAGNFAAEEKALASYDTVKAKKMLHAAMKYNSGKLIIFLMDSNLIAVKTMLLADNLLFDATQGHNYQAFNRIIKTDVMIDLACKLGDLDILSSLVNRSILKCFNDTILSLIQCNNIQLLKGFLQKNYEKALKKRFRLWLMAIGHIKLEGHTNDLLETIVTLLFPQQINAQDKQGNTLLFMSIEANNESAVEFLLKHGASPHIQNYYNESPYLFI